jgi:hypothetical protein
MATERLNAFIQSSFPLFPSTPGICTWRETWKPDLARTACCDLWIDARCQRVFAVEWVLFAGPLVELLGQRPHVSVLPFAAPSCASRAVIGIDASWRCSP